MTDLRPGTVDRLRADILADARATGLDADRVVGRMETGAANAWEERDWVTSDLRALASRRRLDLRDPDQGRRVVEELQGFYDRMAATIDQARAHEAVPENDRLVRTLRAMGRIMQAVGMVAFRDDDQARRFAAELRQRYGEEIVNDLSSGRAQALAGDVGDETERLWIARAVVAAARVHATVGLTLREVARAERGLEGQPDPFDTGDRER